jgi:AcrR family transcriptional regulator
VRITKDPEERRNELMDAAEQLFIEKGYDHTSASDIIRKVGVAQGTFYYYFESKDEILKAVIDRHAMRYIEFVRDIADDDAMSALQKIQGIVDRLISMKDRKRRLSDSLNLEGKVMKHERFHGYVETTLIPLLAKVVRQGIREGVFEVEHPDETTELILLLVRHLISDVRSIEDRDLRAVKAEAATALIEKALGAPKGCLRIKF